MIRIRKLRTGPFAGYWTRDDRHPLIQWLASLFSWRPRWYRERQYQKARREAEAGAQAVIDATLHSMRQALAFLDSLPPPLPKKEPSIAPPFARARMQWLLEQKRRHG